MQPLLITAFVTLAAVLLVVWRQTDDWLLSQLKWLKRQDSDLQLSNRQIIMADVIGLLATGVFLWWLELPSEIALFVVALMVYVPSTFFFNCVLFHVGARRELIFTCCFLSCCIVSVLLFAWPRLELIIPITASVTAIQCFHATRDPYTHYRKGLRILFRSGNPGLAIAAFERARALGADEDRYRFHLGRALIAAGQAETGQQIVTSLLEANPEFPTQLQNDALFQSSWLRDPETMRAV